MDKLDKRILDLLQQDGALTAAAIADRVGLSKAPCWRRIKRMQEEGVIKQTVALLDARALNLGTTVFVTLKTAHHNAAWFDQFVRAVREPAALAFATTSSESALPKAMESMERFVPRRGHWDRIPTSCSCSSAGKQSTSLRRIRVRSRA